MANSESQRDRACASDAENHFLLLELFLASVHVVAETAKSVIQVLDVGIQDRALGTPFKKHALLRESRTPNCLETSLEHNS